MAVKQYLIHNVAGKTCRLKSLQRIRHSISLHHQRMLCSILLRCQCKVLFICRQYMLCMSIGIWCRPVAQPVTACLQDQKTFYKQQFGISITTYRFTKTNRKRDSLSILAYICWKRSWRRGWAADWTLILRHICLGVPVVTKATVCVKQCFPWRWQCRIVLPLRRHRAFLLAGRLGASEISTNAPSLESNSNKHALKDTVQF